jgi:serine/threonine-protein kinase
MHAPGRAGLKTTMFGTEARPGVRCPDADVPPELDAVVEKAVARQPAQRFARVRDLAEAVQLYLDGDRDLERRRQLAVAHTAAASEARDRGARAEAMREAGRALALDPSNGEAAGIVTRLMLEPPAQVPVEVGRALEAGEADLSRAHGRTTFTAFVTYGGILGLLLAQGVTNWLMFGLLAGLIAVLAGSAIIGSQLRKLPHPGLVLLATLGNALLVTMLSRFASPLVVLPGALVAAVMALIAHPVLLSRPLPVMVIMIGGFLAPFGLEAVGVWDPLWTIDGGALVTRSALVDFNGPWTVPLLVLLTIMVTVWTGLATHKLAVLRLDAQRRVELQAWHLRQLVAEKTGRSTP